MDCDWIFDTPPPSMEIHGGSAEAQVFGATIDSFVREVLQNCRDQRLDDSNPVRVRFLLERLSGDHLKSFFASIKWEEQLEERYRYVAKDGQNAIKSRFRDALQRLDETGELTILRIDDWGTMGLTGDEDAGPGTEKRPDYKPGDMNFAALCKHTLITPAKQDGAGGSFGLGKSVLWLFSGFATVLFSSRIAHEGGGTLTRFIGRALLPHHVTGPPDNESPWAGSGWFGQRQEVHNGVRAVSLMDDLFADLYSVKSRLERPAGWKTGTSIAILGFSELGYEEERPLDEVCGDIVTATSRWFWPALIEQKLQVNVQARINDEECFNQDVDPAGDMRPFVDAVQTQPDQLGVEADGVEIRELSVPIAVPGQRADAVRRPISAAPNATVQLRLRIDRNARSGDPDELQQKVALRRGTGMIVSYWSDAVTAGIDVPFHAVLSAGLAVGTSDSDRAVEAFLRAAENVGHDRWSVQEGRLKTEYSPGWKKGIEDFFRAIRAAIQGELTEKVIHEGDTGPDELARMFPFGRSGSGIVAPAEKYTLSGARASLREGRWYFGGAFSCGAQVVTGWSFRVDFLLDQVAGQGTRARIESLTATDPHGLRLEQVGNGSWFVRVDDGRRRVSFEGIATVPSMVESVGLEDRIAARMRVVHVAHDRGAPADEPALAVAEIGGDR